MLLPYPPVRILSRSELLPRRPILLLHVALRWLPHVRRRRPRSHDNRRLYRDRE